MKSKGITLITLVITIIILLILAGITINEIASDNGLLAKTKIARIYSRKSSAEEILKLRITDIQVQNKGTATLQQLLDEFSREEETEIEVIDVVRDEEGILKEIVVKVKEYSEFSFTIGEDLSITKVCNIEYDKWAGETLDTSVEDKKANITIEVTPEKQISQYVDEQIVGIKVTSTKKWTNWSGKYSWTISNEIEPTEWKSLTLNEGSTELEKAGEVIGKEDNQGEYYLWVKIETSKQTEIQSFGPYNMQAAPTVENLICEITSKNSDDIEGIVTVGSNKDFEGWTCVYKINDNEEKIIPTGTTTENVVKNDEITVKFKKEGYTDIIKHIQVTELKELYTIIYNFNGGYSGPGTQKQYDNPNFVIPGFATRYEYIFRGWNTKQDGTGTTYNYGDSINLGSSKSITLYAQWEKVEMTCSIATNSNKLTEGTTITLNATSNDEITIVEAYLGDHLIYSEDISSTNYSKTINISDMNNNLKNLEFLKEYTPNIKITVSGAPKRATTSNITNYTVGNATALETFATTVNNGNALSGENILQVANITSSSNHIPIGTLTTSFRGTYNGQGYTLSQININSPTGQMIGLFGYIENATIKNIKLGTGSIIGGNRVGGAVGYAKNSTINNVNNVGTVVNAKNTYAEVVPSYVSSNGWEKVVATNESANNTAVGGIIGRSEGCTISNCINSSNLNIDATGLSVGGLIGRSVNDISITNCTNKGSITSKSTGTGGIAGVAYGTTIISDCDNSAENISVSSALVGGIVGIDYGVNITNCHNTGKSISGKYSTGGIAGWTSAIDLSIKTTIQGCSNRGTVYSNSGFKITSYAQTFVALGGIVGNATRTDVLDCYNTNMIHCNNSTGELMGIGGIIGHITNGEVSRSYNTGPIQYISDNKSQFHVAGIVGIGNYNVNINNCYNKGSINAGHHAGGILGWGEGCDVEYCYNMGSVGVGDTAAGGIVAVTTQYNYSGVTQKNKILYCYSTGKVSGASNVRKNFRRCKLFRSRLYIFFKRFNSNE